jgi:hypothetical protein
MKKAIIVAVTACLLMAIMAIGQNSSGINIQADAASKIYYKAAAGGVDVPAATYGSAPAYDRLVICGVHAYGTSPFRYKAVMLDATRDAPSVPVDTMYQSGAVGNFVVTHPCQVFVPGALDSFYISTVGADTVWFRFLYRAI